LIAPFQCVFKALTIKPQASEVVILVVSLRFYDELQLMLTSSARRPLKFELNNENFTVIIVPFRVLNEAQYPWP